MGFFECVVWCYLLLCLCVCFCYLLFVCCCMCMLVLMTGLFAVASMCFSCSVDL